LTEESRKLTFGRSLIACPSRSASFFSRRFGDDSRILKYEAILLERDDLTLSTESYLNPAEEDLGRKTQDPMEYCCLDTIEYQTKVSSDLRETPFLDGYRLFVDGSSKMIQRKRHNGYSKEDRK
jgi:hypothetical protein